MFDISINIKLKLKFYIIKKMMKKQLKKKKWKSIIDYVSPSLKSSLIFRTLVKNDKYG